MVLKVREFLELIRFSHTVFALPFALLGAVLALTVPLPGNAAPSFELTWPQVGLRLVGIVLCMFFARSAAMAFNRLVDADIDGKNPRTAERHLPSGRLSRGGVWGFFAAMVGLFCGSCTLFLPNWIPLAGALPVLVLICGYSLAKRFTAAAHLWLGTALAASPLCAWLAMRGEVVQVDPSDIGPMIVLGAAIACWVAGFDIIYACQDADFDRQQGLHSLPARLGVAGALRLAAGFHLGMLLILATLPWLFPQLRLGSLFAVALTAAGVLVVVQHRLVSPTDLRRVNVAFFNVNALISFGLSLAIALDAWA